MMTATQRSTATPTGELDHWIHQVNQLCGQFQASPLDGRCNAAIEPYQGKGLNLSYVNIDKAHVYRTQKDVAGDDGKHFFAVFQLAGRAQMQQGDNLAALDAGDITLIDACRPCDFQFTGMSRQLSLIVPRDQLDNSQLSGSIECGKKVAGNSQLGRLAHQLILGSINTPDLSIAEGEAAVSALVALLKPLVTRHDQIDHHERAWRRALAVIDDNLCAIELTPALIANEVGVSVRSLYRIFATRKLVVAQYIKERRLKLCVEKMRHSHGRESLSNLCFSCGFSDTSYFSTAFKKHFGITPSQYRKRIRLDH